MALFVSLVAPNAAALKTAPPSPGGHVHTTADTSQRQGEIKKGGEEVVEVRNCFNYHSSRPIPVGRVRLIS